MSPYLSDEQATRRAVLLAERRRRDRLRRKIHRTRLWLRLVRLGGAR